MGADRPTWLPASRGGSPYREAYEHGVRMLGASNLYAAEVLDDEPIIAQHTIATRLRDTLEAVTRNGRGIEHLVLARAVRLHLGDRILVSNNQTAVFN